MQNPVNNPAIAATFAILISTAVGLSTLALTKSKGSTLHPITT
jgi:hypothetical protein